MILQSDFIVSHLMLCIIAISTKNDSKKISSFTMKSYKLQLRIKLKHILSFHNLREKCEK